MEAFENVVDASAPEVLIVLPVEPAVFGARVALDEEEVVAVAIVRQCHIGFGRPDVDVFAPDLFVRAYIKWIRFAVARDDPNDVWIARIVVTFCERTYLRCDGVIFFVDGDEVVLFRALLSRNERVCIEVDEPHPRTGGDGDDAVFGVGMWRNIVLVEVAEFERAEIEFSAVFDGDIDGGRGVGVVAIGEHEVGIADDAAPSRGVRSGLPPRFAIFDRDIGVGNDHHFIRPRREVAELNLRPIGCLQRLRVAVALRELAFDNGIGAGGVVGGTKEQNEGFFERVFARVEVGAPQTRQLIGRFGIEHERKFDLWLGLWGGRHANALLANPTLTVSRAAFGIVAALFGNATIRCTVVIDAIGAFGNATASGLLRRHTPPRRRVVGVIGANERVGLAVLAR